MNDGRLLLVGTSGEKACDGVVCGGFGESDGGDGGVDDAESLAEIVGATVKGLRQKEDEER